MVCLQVASMAVNQVFHVKYILKRLLSCVGFIDGFCTFIQNPFNTHYEYFFLTNLKKTFLKNEQNGSILPKEIFKILVKTVYRTRTYTGRS